MMRDAKMPMDMPDTYYQTLEFEIEQLPEIAAWTPGEEYTLIIKVREKEHEVSKENGKVKECARFDVLKVEAAPSQPAGYSELTKKLFK